MIEKNRTTHLAARTITVAGKNGEHKTRTLFPGKSLSYGTKCTFKKCLEMLVENVIMFLVSKTFFSCHNLVQVFISSMVNRMLSFYVQVKVNVVILC